jgi:hypothetical protein
VARLRAPAIAVPLRSAASLQLNARCIPSILLDEGVKILPLVSLKYFHEKIDTPKHWSIPQISLANRQRIAQLLLSDFCVPLTRHHLQMFRISDFGPQATSLDSMVTYPYFYACASLDK